VGDGILSAYTSDHISALDDTLNDWCGQGMVVTSLDISVRGFAAVGTVPRSTGLEYQTTWTYLPDLATLEAWGCLQGASGGIITALATSGKSYSSPSISGPILATSASRRGDTGTYEIKILSGSPLELNTLLPALGAQGYVITAFGTGDQDHFIAVLTRLTGSLTPHTIRVDGPGTEPGPGLADGYILVGITLDQGDLQPYYIYQK
jgi:hypothetical protein